jgi:hypothetical protein
MSKDGVLLVVVAAASAPNLMTVGSQLPTRKRQVARERERERVKLT